MFIQSRLKTLFPLEVIMVLVFQWRSGCTASPSRLGMLCLFLEFSNSGHSVNIILCVSPRIPLQAMVIYGGGGFSDISK